MPDGFIESDENFQRALSMFDSNASYSNDLELITNAQVMLIANIDPDSGLVNGSRGIITGFCPDTELPIVEFLNGTKKTIGTHAWPIEDYEFVSRTQVPLRLAYAITIHKCISEDTLLSVPGVGLTKIKNLESKNQNSNTIYKPYNLYVSGINQNKEIIEIYKGEIENGLKLITKFGYEITTSMRHPLLTFNTNSFIFEWKITPNITKDDHIVLKKGAMVEGNYYPLNVVFTKPYSKIISVPEYINEDIGYFLGLMLGDGCINNKTYRFEILGMDFDILDNCINILDKQFNIKVVRHKRQNVKTPSDRIFFHSKQLIEVFAYIGYNFQKADKKEIPESILTSPLSVQKALIQGLYDTDGGVSNSTINFTTTSEIMGKQLQLMLFNLGIHASRNILKDEVIEKNWKRSFRINMSGKSASKFIKYIGFKCKRKMDTASKLFNESNNSQCFEIPNGNLLIKKLRDEVRNGKKRIKGDKITYKGHRILSGMISKQKLRCDSLNTIIDEIPNISQYTTGNLLSFIYNNGILIDSVKSIENVTNIQMYDIGVAPSNTSGLLPDGHDFIGNGFVNHNCQGATLDSALVDIGSGVFEYGQAYVALSRVRSLEALYVYDFDPVAFKAHPKVKEFYKTVRYNVEDVDDFEQVGPEPDSKQIISELSVPIRGIHVIKEELEEPEGPEENWLYDSVPADWKECLLPCKKRLLTLSNILSTKDFFPSKENIWKALIPIESIKVVILGQDPYPTPGNACGLAFSVLPGVPIPASLKNIYKELVSDGFTAPNHGNLEQWSKNGIMLLNTVLTVEAGSPQSHSKIGWEEVTDHIIRHIVTNDPNTIFILWGKSAQAKKKLGLHKVFESVHPSPLSASKGFFGSKPFSTINEWRREMGKEPIAWNI